MGGGRALSSAQAQSLVDQIVPVEGGGFPTMWAIGGVAAAGIVACVLQFCGGGDTGTISIPIPGLTP